MGCYGRLPSAQVARRGVEELAEVHAAEASRSLSQPAVHLDLLEILLIPQATPARHQASQWGYPRPTKAYPRKQRRSVMGVQALDGIDKGDAVQTTSRCDRRQLTAALHSITNCIVLVAIKVPGQCFTDTWLRVITATVSALGAATWQRRRPLRRQRFAIQAGVALTSLSRVVMMMTLLPLLGHSKAGLAARWFLLADSLACLKKL